MSFRHRRSPLARGLTCAAAAAALALAAGPARAVLGEGIGSVRADQVRMRAAGSVGIAAGGMSVHELRLADGSSVRQYVNAQGIVCAVAWSTRLKPDFAQMLGRHAAAFDAGAAAAAHRPGIKRNAAVRSGDLVVQSGGRLNAFVGKAWLESQMPAGAKLDAIR